MGAFRSFITGSKYHKGAETAISVLEEGEKVYLVRDPQNQYDKHAVRVQNQAGDMLGHVPADLSNLVSDMILMDIIQAEATVLQAGRGKIVFNYDLGNPEKFAAAGLGMDEDEDEDTRQPGSFEEDKDA